MSTLIDERTEPKLNPRQEASAGVRAVSRHRNTFLRLGLGTLGMMLLALVWELAPRFELVDPHFVSPFSEVIKAWWDMAGDGTLWKHFSASFLRSVGGFMIAVVVAVPLGVAIAWYTPVKHLLAPVLETFRNTAALALLPVFTLVLGIGETSKIAIVVFACFFPVLLSTVTGVGTVDPQLLRTAQVLGLSPAKTFTKVVFPAAVPTIFTGIRIAGAASVLVLIAAELVGATAGLGYLISYSQAAFALPQMYAAIITTTAFGLAINMVLVAVERRLSRWRA